MQLILINLGGPRSREEIYPFLKDLFEDPLVFDLPLPEFFRLKLARFIARTRAPKVAEAYASMGFGGGSPLVSETEKQAKAIQTELEKVTNKKWTVKIAMACGFPNLRDLPKEDLIPSDKNIILPLFPHYSRSTTLSIATILKNISKVDPMTQTGWISPFHKNNDYLNATVNLILEYFNGKLPDIFLHLDNKNKIPDWETLPILFSAHGIPLRLIKKGDIYRKEIKLNKCNIVKKLRLKGYRGETFLSFQSRVGPAKWTEPNTIDMLKNLGQIGYKRVAIFPLSFVSDHLETLEEIGSQLKNIAHESGIKEYYRIPAQGIYPEFISALTKIILERNPDHVTQYSGSI